MAALEAMACGLPWISPPVGSMVDCATHPRRSGILVERPSTDACCNALLTLVDMTPEERVDLRANARALVMEQYDLKTQTARLLASLRELTSGQGAL